MVIRSVVAKGSAALLTGVASFVLGASPAVAAEESFGQAARFNHTHTESTGQTVDCPVYFSSSLFRASNSEPFSGWAATDSAIPEDPLCDAYVMVDVRYNDTAGRERTLHGESFGGDVAVGTNDVGSGWVADHTIFYFDCISNCTLTYRTSPK